MNEWISNKRALIEWRRRRNNWMSVLAGSRWAAESGKPYSFLRPYFVVIFQQGCQMSAFDFQFQAKSSSTWLATLLFKTIICFFTLSRSLRRSRWVETVCTSQASAAPC
jgi:hypothetical protein